MPEDTPSTQEVDQFIQSEIDTVPHLEALLLLWNSRPNQWTVLEMANALYVSPGAARNVLQSLARRGLLTSGTGEPLSYCYKPASSQQNDLIEAVDFTYRKNLIRISRMIHSKAAPSIRGFADAFRFTKDRE